MINNKLKSNAIVDLKFELQETKKWRITAHGREYKRTYYSVEARTEEEARDMYDDGHAGEEIDVDYDDYEVDEVEIEPIDE